MPATSLPLCTGKKTTDGTEPTSTHVTTQNKQSLEPPKLDKSPARVSLQTEHRRLYRRKRSNEGGETDDT